MRIKAKKRRTAGAFATAALCLMGAVGLYGKALPDSYRVGRGEKLTLNSFWGITARPAKQGYTTALKDISGQASQSGENILLLFGSVPVKNVTATSEPRPMLVPCGETFGIKLLTDGVIVTELTSVGGRCPARECGIRKGDIIISVNGADIRSNRDVSEAVRAGRDSGCEVRLRRGGEDMTVTLVPTYCEGSYKAGMWVRDSSAGIGTLTFYDADTGVFGGLGHPVCDSDTKEILPLSEGAGDEVLGEITLNCREGLFGTLQSCPDEKEALPLGFKQETERGAAQIYSSIDGEKPVAYDVEIEHIDLSENAEHDMVVHITDPRLLKEAGGIVQGMSGSPVIQNGRLVGAVTHVFIDDPTRGYGIFAEDMAEKAKVS